MHTASLCGMGAMATSPPGGHHTRKYIDDVQASCTGCTCTSCGSLVTFWDMYQYTTTCQLRQRSAGSSNHCNTPNKAHDFDLSATLYGLLPPDRQPQPCMPPYASACPKNPTSAFRSLGGAGPRAVLPPTWCRTSLRQMAAIAPVP